MMIGKNGRTIVFAAAIAMLGGSLYAFASPGGQFPENYRRWTIAKGKLIGPKNPNFATGGGFRYIYVNQVGLEGYGNPRFPEGSAIVDERVQATEDANGIQQEGPTLHVAVMVKDSKQCADTGGWCFNFFKGDDTTVGIPAEAQKACFTQCHSKPADAVFSKFRRP